MQLLRSGLIYTAANFAVAGLPLLLLPLLTRALAPAEYGQVVAFALIVTLSGAFAGLNVHAAVGVMWFQRDAQDMSALTSAALVIAILSTALVAPAAALLLYLFPGAGAGLHPVWGAVAAVTAGANVILQARLGLWQAQQKPWRLALLQVFTATLNLTLSLVAVILLHLGAAGRNGGIAVATLLAASLATVLTLRMREAGGRPAWRHYRDLASFGAPLTLHILAAAMLSTADRWAVSLQLDPRALGVYGAGAQLGMIMAILGDAFVKAYSPWTYARLRSGLDEDKLRIVGAAFLTAPAFLLVALMVGAVLHFAAGWLLGPGFGSAAGVLPWFMAGGAMNGVYLSISSLYFFHGRTGLLATVTAISGVLSLATTLALTSLFGMTGAAMGYAAAHTILAVASVLVASLRFELPWRRPAAALAAVLVDLGAAMRPSDTHKGNAQ